MAAYAALVSLMHVIDDIQHHHSPPISLDEQQLQSLAQSVTFLQEFLEGYNSPVADSNEADPLEMRIADAAYAAEDVIESNIVDRIQPPSKSKKTKFSRFFNYFRGPKKDQESVPSYVNANHDDEQIKCTKLYGDLQQVVEGMDSIKNELMETNWKKAVVQDQRRRFVPASVASLRSSSKSSMVCSDDVLLGIMEKLLTGTPDRVVIPIVGMGGIGKTTLARTLYSKPHIEEHFDVCAWATISQQYNTRDILSELVSQASKIDKKKLSEMSEDELGTKLHKSLFGRRFLIVLDDMWNIDAWDRIQRYFPNTEDGSRVLVTTRLSHLSSKLNNSYSHQMEFLDEVSSWDLFTKTVFGEISSCPSELETIGKKIVENCRGLPLSIVVVGGVLKNMEHTEKCWESIRKNLHSLVNLENDKHCLRLLKTSYNYLPVRLKPCFLYMGVFEEDAEISVSTLVKLWVGEGFVKPKNGKSLETIGKDFLQELIDVNLVRVDRLGSTGNVKSCKIHDLLRDLCVNEGKKDGLYHVVGQDCPRGMNSQRRVVIPKNTSERKVLEELRSTPRARSVIGEYGEISPCQNLGLLRTLHAHKFRKFDDQSDVSSSLLLPVNSRHLAGDVRSVSSLYSSINLLWNIHTLIVSCTRQSTAPAEIWKMPQLRHIEFVERSFCLPDPLGVGDVVVVMENLHTVKGVENFKCSEEVIGRIPNIKKLRIKYVGRDGAGHEDYYCHSNIERLCKLESLCISCSFYKGDQVAYLHKLTFPHSLKKLSLDMKKDFKWDVILETICSLPHLEKLKLWMGCFETGTWEIVEGQFPSLKYLGLFSCFGLKRLIVEEGSVFSCLKQLYLFDLRELEDIDSEFGNVLTLQKLVLQCCSKSAVKSVLKIVDEQKDIQGDQLSFQVQVSLPEENAAFQIYVDYINLIDAADDGNV